MPEKPTTRPSSASHQRRQTERRSSLNGDSRLSERVSNTRSPSPRTTVFFSGVDYRTIKGKIESLENEIEELENDSTPEEQLDSLVLLQLYTSLEYGEKSIENARAYINLSKFYFNSKIDLLPQAKIHILNARKILEQLNIKPIDDHLIPNLLGFQVYLLLIKCSFRAKQYSSQRDIKIKNKHILKINTQHINHDLHLLEEYLEKLQHFMNSKDYDKKLMKYLLIKFDIIINNLNEFKHNMNELIKEIFDLIDKYPSDDNIKHKIDIYLRFGFYLVHYEDHVKEGLSNYKIAVQLAEEEEKIKPSDIHKYQLANAFFQWGKARVRADPFRDSTERDKVEAERYNDNTEGKFQRAIELYEKVKDEYEKDKVIDELAAFYTKIKKYQNALDILRDSVSIKKRLFGEFSEEIIQTESRIGAMYLCECDYVNAAKHLKKCLALQEFVYGSNDSRTCQTHDTLEILKKNPKVSQIQDGKKHDQPLFRFSNKISYEKEDYQLLLTASKKPPINPKN